MDAENTSEFLQKITKLTKRGKGGSNLTALRSLCCLLFKMHWLVISDNPYPSVVAPSSPFSRGLPVLDREPTHTGEFPRVVGHKNRAKCKRVAGEKHIVRADRVGVRAHRFKENPHLASPSGCLLVKGFDRWQDIPQQFQAWNRFVRMRTPGRPVLQLKPGDGGQAAVKHVCSYLMDDTGIDSSG
jgi:hypothetical protein